MAVGREPENGTRRFASHERLDQLVFGMGSVLTGKSSVKTKDKGIQADVEPPLMQRALAPVIVLLAFSLVLNSCGLLVPFVMMSRAHSPETL